jgi:hypothetical protein
MKKLFILLIISLSITTANLFAQVRPAESNTENDKAKQVNILSLYIKAVYTVSVNLRMEL